MTGPVVRRASTIAGGHRVSYQEAGPIDGPTVILVHGLASDSDTWDRAIGPLAERGMRVIAVDLIGHGLSDKPNSTYLLDDFAQSVDSLLEVLSVQHATICGHSLGGAVAVHFSYHFPERVQRLVLVSAGGLGREVHLLLRAAALPGAPRVLSAMMSPRLRRWYSHPSVHRAFRLTPDNLANLQRAGRTLADGEGRAAFFAALRGVIDPAGQRGSFLEMQYLAEHIPTMIVWTEGDGVIPVEHARAAHQALPGSRLVLFPGGGHEPHRRHAEDFAQAVARFVGDT